MCRQACSVCTEQGRRTEDWPEGGRGRDKPLREREERREAAGVRVHQGTTSQGWRQARTAAGGHRAGNRELSFLLLHLKC